MSRRVLVTGADTFWGGRMIQALEDDPSIEVILGMGAHVPAMPFERAEFVRADQSYSILNRIVRATQVDTILHTFLITNSATVPRRAMHEINVIGTMNLLAAAGAAGSSVRHIVIKSSTLVYGSAASDPNTFLEDTVRTSPVRNVVERVAHRSRGPGARLRGGQSGHPRHCAPLCQRAGHPSHDSDQPQSVAASVPCIFGFDPLLQFVEEEDVVRALLHVTRGGVPGLYNVAGEGRLPWSEVAAICGTRLVPLSPYSRLQDPSLGPPVRPPRGARGPVALRPRCRHPALRRDWLHVRLDQRGSSALVHQGSSASQAIRSHAAVLYLRA